MSGVVLRLTPPVRRDLQTLSLLVVPHLNRPIEAAAEYDVRQYGVHLR